MIKTSSITTNIEVLPDFSSFLPTHSTAGICLFADTYSSYGFRVLILCPTFALTSLNLLITCSSVSFFLTFLSPLKILLYQLQFLTFNLYRFREMGKDAAEPQDSSCVP